MEKENKNISNEKKKENQKKINKITFINTTYITKILHLY